MPRPRHARPVRRPGGTGHRQHWPPPLSPGGAGASAPSALSTASAGLAAGFALCNVATSRSRVFTLVASRSRSLVTSANCDSQSRLSSLALDRRASRSRLAASALMARASHAPARCWSTHSCTTPLCPRPPTGSAGSARTARSAGVAVRRALGGGGGACPLRGALSACASGGVRPPRRQ